MTVLLQVVFLVAAVLSHSVDQDPLQEDALTKSNNKAIRYSSMKNKKQYYILSVLTIRKFLVNGMIDKAEWVVTICSSDLELR